MDVVSPSLSCQKMQNGGNIIACQDELISEIVSIGTMAFKASAVRAEPQINLRSSTAPPSNARTPVETDDRGDVLIRGLWSNGQDAIIDIWVTDTDQSFAGMRDPKKVLQSQEKEKKKKYLSACLKQRRAFTTFVISVDGLLGQEAQNVIKQLSLRLAVKW